MGDQEIIQLFWNRSENAIVQMTEKYGKYCFTIAWNILYNREDSDECVNDTCLHAWNAMPPQRPDILKAFLGKITRNLALNRYEGYHALKRGAGQISYCLDELAECIADTSSTESIVEQMVLTECLNNFLATLKAEERSIFVRRYWYVSSVSEIAQDYGYSESKIKMMLLRTRHKLKEALEREGISTN
ncbi:MAG: sigma-70 family RNA polymerase sigma factor [Lachnospiraceae bacterium]|nr:sigma-70 family RNA polymerase sigma factor [Lachnospiraceae bacterium]